MEHNKRDDSLDYSEKKMRAWLENSPVCTKIVDLDFNLQYMSSAGIKSLHINDITPFYGKPYPFDFYPESFRDVMSENMEKAAKTGEVSTQEASVINIDGNVLWFHSTIVPVNNEEGHLDHLLIVSADITSRKKAEGELVAINRSLEQRVAERTEELKKKNVELSKENVERKKAEIEIKQLNESLEQRVAERTAKLSRTNRELRKAQVQIEDSRQEYTDLYDFAPVGYITLDKEGLVLKANLTIGKMLSTGPNMILNSLFNRHIDRDYQDIFYLHLRKLFVDKKSLTCEVGLCRKNGTKFYVRLDSILVHDYGGNNACRTSITDITKRKQAEEQLKESRQKYTDLYDFAPTGLLALDDKGVILEANRTVVKMLSIKQPHLLIKSLLHNYIDMAYQDIFYLHLREIFEGKETAVCELVFRNKLHARLDSVIGQHSGSNNICKTSITDITGIEG